MLKFTFFVLATLLVVSSTAQKNASCDFDDGSLFVRPTCNIMSKWTETRKDDFNRNLLYNYLIELSGSDISDFGSIASKYVSSELYIQHDPNIPDGLDGLIDYFSQFTGGPPAIFTIFRMASENDLVWVHMRIAVGEMETATMEIFRFECGWIVEHWIVSTTITSGPFANTHPYF